MFESNILLFIVIFLFLLWIFPALILTIKVQKIKRLDPAIKKQIIIPMWVVPLFENLICYMMFAKTGKLNRLSKDEHRSIWAAAPKK